MYMSRIAINRRCRGGMKLLGSRHAMHAAVMSAFPPGTPTQSDEGRVLWRVDRHGETVDLLIVSPSKPCLTHINEQAGWSTGSPWVTREYTPFLESLKRGDEYVFRLTANPTHRISTTVAGIPQKRIVGHVTNEYQRQWFLDRSASNGFDVVTRESDANETTSPELFLRDRDTAVFRRSTSRVTLTTASFEGRLRVTDPNLVRRALTNGIGRAKGYGCGLLTLLPVG